MHRGKGRRLAAHTFRPVTIIKKAHPLIARRQLVNPPHALFGPEEMDAPVKRGDIELPAAGEIFVPFTPVACRI